MISICSIESIQLSVLAKISHLWNCEMSKKSFTVWNVKKLSHTVCDDKIEEKNYLSEM